jgi:two-component system CheB/CheR fusion protein
MNAARGSGRSEDERWHLRKDGSRLFCSGVLTPLADGEIHGYAKIARDLTGVKQAETLQEEMLAMEKATRRAAENASRMREEFLAVLSHELKQPLNLIHLNAEMLKRMPEVREAPRLLRIADTIRNATISQATLIDDLLDLSRVRTGKLRLNKTVFNLAQVVERITQAFFGDAESRNIQLANETAEDPIMVRADITRVEQIIWNLLSNAIKFTSAGGRVRIAAFIDQDNACLSVADTGKGIAPEFLPHIFEMFNQADGSTTREHGGLGIGLALVRQLAESHGGMVKAMSKGLGEGAEFHVCLPVDGVRAADPTQPEASDQCEAIMGKRLLLIDDDQGTLNVFGDLLKSHGAELMLAHNADEALQHAQQHSFDLIVSDIAMPGTDGYQLLAALRQLPLAAKVPVIAITGFGRMVDVERALAAGFAAHMQKPVVFEAFAKTVSALLGGKADLDRA